MKKLWSKIALLVVVVLAITFVVFQKQKEADEIRIGVITPLSGDSAKYGEDIKRGYDLAVEEINSKGDIKGKKLRLIYEDSEGKPGKAVAAAQKLIHGNKVIAILGALWSSPTLAVAPIAEENNVLLLSSGSSSPKVTNAGDYTFRNEISEAYGGEIAARLYFDQGFKKIAVLYLNNDYGVGLNDFTVDTYAKLGGTVTISEAFEQDEKDFRTQLLKVKNTSPQAVLIVSYKEAILIIRQMHELGMADIQVLGSTLFEDAEIVEKLGDLAHGVIYSYYGTFYPESEEPIIQDFLTRFRRQYECNPSYYAPIGYDAVKILSQAIEKGGFTSEKIKAALYKIKDFPGVSGTTSFDENGDVIKPVILKEIKHGEFLKYEP